MTELHDEIDDLLSEHSEEDRYSSPLEARKKAMDFLARREYGQAELIGKLADRGFLRNIAADAVLTLTHEGLQSDQRFAENFAQSRIHQGKGPIRIRLDLRERGLSDAVIEVALEETGADWRELAIDAKRKKFGRAPAADFKNKARQMRFLQYRGFEQDQIQAAVGDD